MTVTACVSKIKVGRDTRGLTLTHLDKFGDFWHSTLGLGARLLKLQGHTLDKFSDFSQLKMPNFGMDNFDMDNFGVVLDKFGDFFWTLFSKI